MNRCRRIAAAFIVAVLAVGFAGCERIAGVAPEAAAPDPESVSIGVVVSLTGQYAEPYGFSMQRGFELAREDINARGDVHLTFVTEDDQSTIAGAQAAVQHLAVDHAVSAIVGIAISTQLKHAFPIAQENGVVAFSSVSSAAGLSAIGDFIFRAGLATDISIPAGVMATRERLGYQRVAAIYDEADAFSTSSNAEIGKALGMADVDILTVEAFQTGDTDFSEQLTRILESAPDALFISGLSPEVTQIMIQADQLGFPDSVHIILADLSLDDIRKVGEASEGTVTFKSWSTLVDTPGNSDFIQKYQEKYGIEPEEWAAQSYATLQILAAAIANANSADSAAIRDALAQTRDFPTILGDFSFDPNGEALYEPAILIVKNGEFQAFE